MSEGKVEPTDMPQQNAEEDKTTSLDAVPEKKPEEDSQAATVEPVAATEQSEKKEEAAEDVQAV
jgi:hypothetical protein